MRLKNVFFRFVALLLIPALLQQPALSVIRQTSGGSITPGIAGVTTKLFTSQALAAEPLNSVQRMSLVRPLRLTTYALAAAMTLFRPQPLRSQDTLEYPGCHGAYCYSTAETLVQYLSKLPPFASVEMTRSFEQTPTGWILVTLSVKIPGAANAKVIMLSFPGLKPVELAKPPVFISSLVDTVSAATLSDLLKDPQRLASFESKPSEAPEAVRDSAGIPIVSEESPAGRLAWEKYAENEPITLMTRDADGAGDQTFYFPFSDNFLGTPHAAASDRERIAAAEFDRLVQTAPTGGWPVALFFVDDLLSPGDVDRKTIIGAQTDRISFRDREGNLTLGVAVIINSRWYPQAFPKDKADILFIRKVLSHELEHVPVVWSRARDVKRIADQIAGRLPEEPWRQGSQEELEGLVESGLLAAGELNDMDRLKAKAGPVNKNDARSERHYRSQNRTKMQAAINSIIQDYFGPNPSGKTRRALVRWLKSLLLEEVPPIPAPQPSEPAAPVAMQETNRYAGELDQLLRFMAMTQAELRPLVELGPDAPEQALDYWKRLWLAQNKQLNFLIGLIPFGENDWLPELVGLIVKHFENHPEIRLKDYRVLEGEKSLFQVLRVSMEGEFDAYRKKMSHGQILDSKRLFFFFNGLGPLPDPLRIDPKPEDQEFFRGPFFDKLVLGMLEGLLGFPNPDDVRRPEDQYVYHDAMLKSARLVHTDHDRNALKRGELVAMQPPRPTGHAGVRETAPIRADEFGNPLSALEFPFFKDIFDFLKAADGEKQVNEDLSNDRLYYGLSRREVQWFLDHAILDSSDKHPLTVHEILGDRGDTRYTLGRMESGGRWVIRREKDVLQGWDYFTQRNFAGSLEPGDKEKIDNALHRALGALGYTPEHLEHVLRDRNHPLRFEVRSRHDFKGERDRYNDTVILHQSLLDHPDALLIVMIDEIRHVMTGDNDARNTAPALKASARALGVYRFYSGLTDLGAGEDALALVTSLYTALVTSGSAAVDWDAYDIYFGEMAEQLLWEKGEALDDPYGHPRQTLPTGQAGAEPVALVQLSLAAAPGRPAPLDADPDVADLRRIIRDPGFVETLQKAGRAEGHLALPDGQPLAVQAARLTNLHTETNQGSDGASYAVGRDMHVFLLTVTVQTGRTTPETWSCVVKWFDYYGRLHVVDDAHTAQRYEEGLRGARELAAVPEAPRLYGSWRLALDPKAKYDAVPLKDRLYVMLEEYALPKGDTLDHVLERLTGGKPAAQWDEATRNAVSHILRAVADAVVGIFLRNDVLVVDLRLDNIRVQHGVLRWWNAKLLDRMWINRTAAAEDVIDELLNGLGGLADKTGQKPVLDGAAGALKRIAAEDSQVALSTGATLLREALARLAAPLIILVMFGLGIYSPMGARAAHPRELQVAA